MGRYIGIDLHRNCFTVCTLAENGRYYFREWKLRQLGSFSRTLREDDELAVEMTTNTRLFLNAVRDRVKRVVIVDSSRFKLIAQSVKKTDKNDAELLTYFLSKDMLPELRMKDKRLEQLKSLTQTRDKLVKQRTQLKNKINNILAAHGICLKRESMSGERGLQMILEYRFEPMVQLEIRVLIEQIRSLNQGVKELEEVIKEEGRRYEAHRILRSIKGIGDLSASILLSIIGDVSDFSDSGRLASYFGIVPRVSNSNETERSGRITKRGTKLGRTTLVQCALIAKRYSPYLSRFHERIKSRRGGGKANIALARKLLNIAYLALTERIVFTDFENFEYVRLAA